MQRLSWIFCCLLILLLSCENSHNQSVGAIEEERIDSIQIKTTNNEPHTSNGFNSGVGMGLLQIDFRTNQVAVYIDSHLQVNHGFMDFQKPVPRLITSISTDTIQWFLHPTEYNNGMFIAPFWNDSVAKITVNTSNNKTAYWINIHPSRFEKQPKVKVLPWEIFLTSKTLLISDSIINTNGLFSLPDTSSTRIDFKPYYTLYSADSVVNNWIRLKNLKVMHDVYGSDTFTESIGWFRWWKKDEFQVFFPDFYTLEAFYSQEQ